MSQPTPEWDWPPERRPRQPTLETPPDSVARTRARAPFRFFWKVLKFLLAIWLYLFIFAFTAAVTIFIIAVVRAASNGG